MEAIFIKEALKIIEDLNQELLSSDCISNCNIQRLDKFSDLPLDCLDEIQSYIDNSDLYEKKFLFMHLRELVLKDVPLSCKLRREKAYDYACVARDLGIYEITCAITTELLKREYYSTEIDQSIWKYRYLYARALRGVGQPENALEQYFLLLKESKGDFLLEAKALLMIGKAYHSNFWRLSFYEFFVKAALKRLKKEQGSKDISEFKAKEIMRVMGITLDAFANLKLERHIVINGMSPDEALFYDLAKIWEKSISITNKVGKYESDSRVRCRRAYAQFLLSEKTEYKDEAYNIYVETVSNISSLNLRGLAVREGYLADMLIEYGNLEKAEQKLIQACEYSEKLSDWRTYAKNQIRLSKLWQKRRGIDRNTVLSSLDAAERALSRTGEPQFPELLVDVYMERANFHKANGEHDEARVELLNAVNVLIKLEKELSSFEQALLSSNNCFGLVNYFNSLLTTKEYKRVQKAMDSDFRLLARLQNKLLGNISRQYSFLKEEAVKKKSLLFWYEMTIGQGHHLTSTIKNLKDDIVYDLENIGKEVDGIDHAKLISFKDKYSTRLSSLKNSISSQSHSMSSLEIKFVDVASVVTDVCNYWRPIFSAEGVEVQFDFHRATDEKLFELQCVPGVLEMIVAELIQNSYKAIRSSQVLEHKGIIRLQVAWKLKGKGEIDYGVLLCSDNSGRYSELEHAYSDSSNNRNGEGVTLIKLFFSKFQAKPFLHQGNDGRSTIEIRVERGDKARGRSLKSLH